MKRYMFSFFFIDTLRNILAAPLPPELATREKQSIAEMLALKHGREGLTEKLERYLSFKPPDICVVTEFHNMLLEANDAYICGHLYPALTGACSLGERILNILILRLRDYFRSTGRFKEVCNKDSFQNWENAISILMEWHVIPDGLGETYLGLEKNRQESIHFRELPAIEQKAHEAIVQVNDIVDQLFGLKSDVLFDCGHLFVKKEKGEEPLVKKFYVPACHLVGYKYKTESRADGTIALIDEQAYEDREVTDEEWIRLREDWLAQPPKS